MEEEGHQLSSHDALCVRWGTFGDRVKENLLSQIYKKHSLRYHRFTVVLAPDLFLPQEADPQVEAEFDAAARECDRFIYPMGIWTWKEIEPYAYMLLYHIGKDVQTEFCLEKQNQNLSVEVDCTADSHCAFLTISFTKSTIFKHHSFDKEESAE